MKVKSRGGTTADQNFARPEVLNTRTSGLLSHEQLALGLSECSPGRTDDFVPVREGRRRGRPRAVRGPPVSAEWPMNPKRIAIIGGGPGGLMTAYLLQKRCRPRCEVTLYE